MNHCPRPSVLPRVRHVRFVHEFMHEFMHELVARLLDESLQQRLQRIPGFVL